MYLLDTNVLSEIRKIQSHHTPPEFLRGSTQST